MSVCNEPCDIVQDTNGITLEFHPQTSTRQTFDNRIELIQSIYVICDAARAEPGIGYRLGADDIQTRELIRSAIITAAMDDNYTVESAVTRGIWQIKFSNGSIIRVQDTWED